MPNIRRGFAFGASGEEDSAARANAGSIDSRNGSESRMPVPWRKRRREMARRVAMKGADGGWFMGLGRRPVRGGMVRRRSQDVGAELARSLGHDFRSGTGP